MPEATYTALTLYNIQMLVIVIYVDIHTPVLTYHIDKYKLGFSQVETIFKERDW